MQSTTWEDWSKHYRTISDALGTSPSSFNVAPKSTASKTFFGKFWVKLCTSIPASWLSNEATSKSVVSAGKDFWILPPDVCSRSRASVYADAGFEAAGPDLMCNCPTKGSNVVTRPSRSALSFSVRCRLSSLSATILALILSLAATSSCFSLRFAAASFSCSFFFKSSLISCVCFVLLRRISLGSQKS